MSTEWSKKQYPVLFYDNFRKYTPILTSGGSRIFIKGMRNSGSGGRKSPSGVQGRSPGGGLGAKPPEARDIMLNLQLITSENFNIKK